MKFHSRFIAVLIAATVSYASSEALAQSAPKSVPTEKSVKALIVANKNGGPRLTAALVKALKDNPALADVLISASKDASPELLSAISAALSQAIVEIAQTNPEAAAKIKQDVEAKAPDALKQQVAANLTNSTTATASTGNNGPLGDVGVPLSSSTPSSSRSPS